MKKPQYLQKNNKHPLAKIRSRYDSFFDLVIRNENFTGEFLFSAIDCFIDELVSCEFNWRWEHKEIIYEKSIQELEVVRSIDFNSYKWHPSKFIKAWDSYFYRSKDKINNELSCIIERYLWRKIFNKHITIDDIEVLMKKIEKSIHGSKFSKQEKLELEGKESYAIGYCEKVSEESGLNPLFIKRFYVDLQNESLNKIDIIRNFSEDYRMEEMSNFFNNINKPFKLINNNKMVKITFDF